MPKDWLLLHMRRPALRQRLPPLGKGHGPTTEAWRSWRPGFQPDPVPSAQIWNSWMPKGKSKGDKGDKNGKGNKGKGLGVMDHGQFQTLGAMG